MHLESHNINTTKSLRFLNLDLNLRSSFEEYFNDGMTISNALR